ncbi:glucan endo-1,3-beta-glucosidase-like [Chenopodium quinoa]|uniref:Glucan endo-1,3-beta-D-glucosidase n=1 Tax=Chenopodium quinoa TaxID=63459 RepID=A0A803KMA0_CHEQI|nr:glucan endo-1,3-beta-glucosidase-like [Chenopodium quinoa]
MAATTLLFIAAFLFYCLHPTEAQIGVCYGKIGDNLPSSQDVVNLYKSNGIKAMRLYFPDQDTLQALQGTNIELMLGVANENIESLASCSCAAKRWVRRNVLPFGSLIKYVVVGNEINPSDKQASSVLPAMQNIIYALNASQNSNNLNDEIKVSTAINTNLIKNSYPPSNGQFQDLSYITPIIDFLNSNDSPLLVNIYPYFAYINDTQHISLDYALFNAPEVVFTDPNNGLDYKNLLDAMVDSVYAALRKAGANHPRVIVSESGWPSRGGSAATMDNAKAYYENLANHVKQGTPLMAGQPIETYLFAMFDENQKQGASSERNFGIFYPNQQSKYGQLNF